MRNARNLLCTLLAAFAMFSLPAWNSPASACLYDSVMNVVGGAWSPMAAHHMQSQQHHMASRHQEPAPSSGSGGTAAPRMDCAACVAVLPAFPSVGSHELMPFMPMAQSFEPLSGIEPVLDPPPPRQGDPKL
jgi:hypothetical protein